MTPLLYSNNADIKYPLSDFHELDIPNDILLDLSLNVPEAYDPVVVCVRVTPNFVFVAIEDRTSGLPIAHLMQVSPAPARVYPLELAVDGTGWLVLGPGIRAPFYIGDVEVDLDPETIVSLEQTGLPISLSTNTFDRELENVLKIASSTDFLSVSVEGNTIYLDRSDESLSQDQLIALKSGKTGGTISDSTQYIFSVGGTTPDALGNIDIDIVGKVRDCGSFGELEIPRGDEGGGDYEELPLDIFQPRTYEPGDDCAPTTSSSASPVAEEVVDYFVGPTDIINIPLIDITAGKAIGSLYTVPEEA
jgi:hypothetical protein